jgi:hypothetical protein
LAFLPCLPPPGPTVGMVGSDCDYQGVKAE